MADAVQDLLKGDAFQMFELKAIKDIAIFRWGRRPGGQQ
jgi:hypothetical protein